MVNRIMNVEPGFLFGYQNSAILYWLSAHSSCLPRLDHDEKKNPTFTNNVKDVPPEIQTNLKRCASPEAAPKKCSQMLSAASIGPRECLKENFMHLPESLNPALLGEFERQALRFPSLLTAIDLFR